ncbi:hypothetical protein [Flavobacterium sp. HTF]|uniref:hypothetical protein n=1 Tax=Flavobacterium sp. HTF TaxID=2170732 RepID=UPI000D5E3D7C|nr:hypothetical protein [Flavobacterium sp. HTF]PWB24495.1 hypothetical protein DCO46_11650 [Flavobacterium sp. HTF]
MNRIRKTVIFISFLVIAFFAAQANSTSIEKTENTKTDTNLSVEIPDSLSFIQPQASYHFVGNIKTNYPALAKWFDSILMIIPAHEAVKSVSNFNNQHLGQSTRLSLLLYPFHYFW